jgi:glycosyltransferase involved in cell wall biosynthesis
MMKHESLPLVTIAIPTYNRAGSYLPVALNAARAQNYPRLEIIVADNASSDDTAAFMQGISDSRLRYLRHQVNIGANRNYNYCLSKACGDYFLLLHDDDAIDADFVEVCMEAAQHTVRPGIIRTGVRVIDARGETQREIANRTDNSSLGRFYCSWFASQTCWYLVNTLFHTAQLRAEGGFHSPHHLSEDGFAIARLARFHRVDVRDVKASFRVHADEQTMAGPAAGVLWGREYLALLDCMCSIVGPAEVDAVRRQGRRFFARLAYNRAALLRSRAARLRAYGEVLRLFEYRYWPTHRSKTLQLFRQAAAYARRCAESSLARTVALARNAGVR